MSRRLLNAAIAVALVAAAFVAFALPASAEQRTFKVRLATGSFVTVTVDAPCGPMGSVGGLPGTPVAELTPPEVCTPESPPPAPTPQQPTPPPADDGGGQGGGGGDTSSGGGDTSSGGGGDRGDRPSSNGGDRQGRSGSRRPADRKTDPGVEDEGSNDRGGKKKKRPRRSDGVPTPDNPTYFDALPGPAPTSGVPNFVIQKFKVPIFLLPIYQAAGIQYGVRWEVLAAINEIETDYGRNLNVSSAGALGWMQFMPATWKMYGTDANRDGKRDPYNPVDAIFAAARYLKAAGADTDLRKAIFAYNRANWYVDSVLLRARLIAGYPPDFVGSLTGLTEGRFPVAARAKYADDALEAEQTARRKLKPGENAAQVIEGDENRRGVRIFARAGAPVVAVNDGVVKKIGFSETRGRYLVVQDVYGNQYTYSRLGSVQKVYPVPKQDLEPDTRAARLVRANGDPKPTGPASAGTQRRAPRDPEPAPTPEQRAGAPVASGSADQPAVTYKARLFAHPARPQARKAGGLEQIFDRETRGKGYDTYDAFFAKPIGLNAENSRLRPLKKGSRVVGGTILGRIGKTDAQTAPHVYFEIRPAGKGAPKIDPKPILDGWKLLESTAIYRASGKNALYGENATYSVGQVLMLPKPLLQKRVLADARIDIYPGGRNDIKTGQIDRRVLATIAYLAESGLKPTITSLKAGRSTIFTSSGNISDHISGNAVDIATINGVPISGNQDPGGVTDQAVKRLMLLQGTMKPSQIISLIDYGSNTLAMADHADHIHVGFQPLFGANAKLGRQTASILEPGQWDDLIERLGSLEQPTVPTEPSKYSLPAKRKASAYTTGD